MHRHSRNAGAFLVFVRPAQPAGMGCRAEEIREGGLARLAVQKVLRAEMTGRVDRREQLAETLKSQPDSSLARWQSGFVRSGHTGNPLTGRAPRLPNPSCGGATRLAGNRPRRHSRIN